MSNHIIVGIDGSKHSITAYDWALDEARRRDADLTAVFAWETPLMRIPGAFDRRRLEQSASRSSSTSNSTLSPRTQMESPCTAWSRRAIRVPA